MGIVFKKYINLKNQGTFSDSYHIQHNQKI